MKNVPLPAFSGLIGPRAERVVDELPRAAGCILRVVMLLSFVVALGLVFDPRYRDFPFAPFTAAVLPFIVHGFLVGRAKRARSVAESSAACVLALSASYIVFNEGFANWQSLWLCAVLVLLAFNLVQARAVRS
jgi:hypothetical protein